jgi:hypothetical protein
MASQTFYVPTGQSRDAVLERVGRLLQRLPVDKQYEVEVRAHKPKRSTSQNALMWALYDQIIARGGEAMRGWDRRDIHDLMCGECFGWQQLDGFARKRMKPTHGTSGLNKQQFSDFLEFVVRYMAERGVTLDLPEQEAA